MRRVEVSAYQPKWKDLFEQEARRLCQLFGSVILDIHHIGSTSVLGLHAKPIIDIMPVVQDIEKVDAFHDDMIQLGYEPKGEFGISGRRYFPKGGEERTHHVHMFQTGSPHIERHLAFRDFLRTHPDVAKQYGWLKTDLAQRYPENMNGYIEGKNDFVQTTEKRALEWYQNSRTN
ncbi:GrpB family protein [Salinibacillus xinjiangensis]|uniref:GrpB family protein n=1 Tax=Salinibacillus xinjiangensis TaxID=1229268 RepID=A0A6G1X5B8_9BACI|nr:GrpB family protein [Salinibacillus xinjiangensis]MRG86119.1 GrpB family protein [Salinibacillus xinjiangensis]